MFGLKANATQTCPSRGCQVWHTSHGVPHVCGIDTPDPRRGTSEPSNATCPQCKGPAPTRNGRVAEHPAWGRRTAGDGRTVRVQTRVTCPGAGLAVTA